MQLYVVGGAVRDRLLGLTPQDRDWVAVGTTPEELVALGFKPVGRDFPVFLHPRTGEEVALARTERKSAPGYRGFVVHAAPEVTLEEDLARRDLTINAIAQAEDGTLIDPFGGARDLAAGMLRHVSPAFVEDPVRLLRVARFAARWPHFTLAPETAQLLARMVAAGEVDALVPERVWQEVARGLMTPRPSRMFEVLAACGALARLWPELREQPRAQARLDLAAAAQATLPERFALLDWRDAAAVDTACERLRVPLECRALARLFVCEQAAVDGCDRAGAAEALALLERADALRRPERFESLLRCCDWARRSAGGDAVHGALVRLRAALRAARDADSAGSAASALAIGARGPAVGTAVRAARLAAIEAAWRSAP